MRSHTRVVVIGGGAVGASCLYHLARTGVGGYVLRAHFEPDREFEIEILGERRRAIASPMPFYDPENKRLRGLATG